MLDFSTPFWREEPLDEAEEKLLAALFSAHAVSARRDNLSTHAVIGSAIGSADYFKAMAAPMLTLGSLHGPIVEACRFLSIPRCWEFVPDAIRAGRRIPGWGTSFVKGEHDAAWYGVLELLPFELLSTMARVTAALRHHGKCIFPNPAGFTAAAAMVLRMPAEIAPYLFLAGRLEVWTSIFAQHATTGKIWQPPPQQ